MTGLLFAAFGKDFYITCDDYTWETATKMPEASETLWQTIQWSSWSNCCILPTFPELMLVCSHWLVIILLRKLIIFKTRVHSDNGNIATPAQGFQHDSVTNAPSYPENFTLIGYNFRVTLKFHHIMKRNITALLVPN